MQPAAKLVIVFVDLAVFGADLVRLADEGALLPPNERARLARVTDPDTLQQRKATQAALRLALSDVVPADVARADFVRSPSGKPSLAGGLVHFSLAHTDAAALIAISNGGPVGVDIEGARDVAVGADRHAAYTRAAITLGRGVGLPGATDHDRFVAAWTRVEAIAKATGLGIAGLIAAIDLRGAATGPLDAHRLDAALGTGQARLVAHDLALPRPNFGAVAKSAGLPMADVAVLDGAKLQRWANALALQGGP